MVLVVPDCFDDLISLEAAGRFMPPVFEGDRLSFIACGVAVWTNLAWAETAYDEYRFINNLCYVFKGVKSSRRVVHLNDLSKNELTGEVKEIVDTIPCPFAGDTREFISCSYMVSPYGYVEWWIEAASFELHIPEQNLIKDQLLPPNALWVEGSLIGV